jgi:hypothetical protein
MSDKWLRIQHDEIRDRNRQQREATMRDAHRLAALRTRRQPR